MTTFYRGGGGEWGVEKVNKFPHLFEEFFFKFWTYRGGEGGGILRWTNFTQISWENLIEKEATA